MTDYKVRALLMLGRTAAAVAALPASARGESGYRASLRARSRFAKGGAVKPPTPIASPHRRRFPKQRLRRVPRRSRGATPARRARARKSTRPRVADLTKAVDLNPRDPLARRYRADAHRALGHRLAAIDDARAALALGGPEANLLMMLGVDEYLAGVAGDRQARLRTRLRAARCSPSREARAVRRAAREDERLTFRLGSAARIASMSSAVLWPCGAMRIPFAR